MERKSYVKPVIENNELISSSFIAASKDVVIVGYTDIDNCFHLEGSDLVGGNVSGSNVSDSQLTDYLSDNGVANDKSVCVYLSAANFSSLGCGTKFGQNECTAATITYAGKKADGTNLFKADFSTTCTPSWNCNK